MIIQPTNHKKLMVIHNIQTKLRLIVAIVHTSDSKNLQICAHIGRFHRKKLHACVRMYDTCVRFPLCRYTLYTNSICFTFQMIEVNFSYLIIAIKTNNAIQKKRLCYRLGHIVQRISVCSVQIINKDFFGPIFFALCRQQCSVGETRTDFFSYCHKIENHYFQFIHKI